jgi:small redox-active disulfide protein 2
MVRSFLGRRGGGRGTVGTGGGSELPAGGRWCLRPHRREGRAHVENEGLNANLGLVVTGDGALLIDSGATYGSARQIHEAVKRVTSQPVKWVFNTGGQDHRWLGNGYFAAQGAEVIAHANAEADMKNRGNDHLQGLKAVLGQGRRHRADAADALAAGQPDERLELGGVLFEFKHRGGAHTPGDTMVWLPQKNVLFSGDVVYVERLLGVLPVSRTQRWLETFAVIERLQPKVIVPGHGSVTDVATAKADTQAYLLALRAHMGAAVKDMSDVERGGQELRRRALHAAAQRRRADARQRQPHLSGNGTRVDLALQAGGEPTMEIKVLGTGCAKCKSTVALIDEVAKAKGVAIDLAKVEDMRDIVGYGVMSTPAVVVDGRVVHSGGVPSRDKVEQWLAA